MKCKAIWEQALLRVDSQRGVFSHSYEEPCHLPLPFPRYFAPLTSTGLQTLSPQTEAKFVHSVPLLAKLQQDWSYAQTLRQAKESLRHVKPSIKVQL